MKRFLLLLFTILLLTACGSKLDGTYAEPTGNMKLTFKSNGKVSQTQMGMEIELNYEIEGNKIKIPTPQGATLVMTILDDGSIDYMGFKFKKQNK